MSRPRSLRHPLAAVVSVPLVFVACGGGGARAASDGAAVKAGLESWCESLARTRGKGKDWEKMAECKAASVTASGQYLKFMGQCYEQHVANAGKDAPDDQKILTDCLDDVMVKVNAPASLDVEVFEARCERGKRCEKIEIAECKAALDKLQPNQKAVLVTQYNEAAQHEIADCLRSEGCSQNEDEARQKCYSKAEPKMLWFP